MSEESSSSRAANRLLVRTVATLAAITSSYTTTAQTSPPSSLCSCSPTKFNFQLNFQGNCDSSSLTGVSDELCFINVRPSDSVVDIEAILSKVFASETRSKKEDDFWRRLSHDDDTSNQHSNNQNQRVLNSVIPTRVTNVEIFEYDTTDVLNIINQETFSNQSLSDGDIIEFTSISSQLDPNKPLQDQLQYFPGGLILKYVGVNSNNEHVRNTISWNYSIEDCTTEQISVGNFIGWTIVEDVTLVNGAFCPATVTPPPTLSPTTTAKPVTPTIGPSIILPLSPTNNPTITAKPVTPTNNPTITAKPVTPTSSPTITAKPVSPTIGPTTSAKPVTAKPVTEKPVTAKPVTATISPSIIKPSPPTIGPTIAEPVTAKPVTEKPVTAKPVTAKTSEPTTPSKASKFLASKSKAGKDLPSKADKVSHSPIHDWSGGHHKPTPSPVYIWKDKPTASPIYDWTDKDPTKMPTPTPTGVKSPSPAADTGWGGDGWDQGKPKPTGDKPTQEGSLIIGIVPSKSPSQDVPTQYDNATKMPVLDWVFTKSPIYNTAPLVGSRTIGIVPSKSPSQVVATRDEIETKTPVLDWVFTKSPIYNIEPSNKPTPTTSDVKTEWSSNGGKHDTKSNKGQGTKSGKHEKSSKSMPHSLGKGSSWANTSEHTEW